MIKDYMLKEKNPEGLESIKIQPINNFYAKDLTRIMQPKFDPQDTLKSLEMDLTLCSLTDIESPDKSNLIRPREEENKMWDIWHARRMGEISAQEQRYAQMVNSAVENGQMDSSEANRVLFSIGTQFGPFAKLKQRATDVYNHGRKF